MTASNVTASNVTASNAVGRMVLSRWRRRQWRVPLACLLLLGVHCVGAETLLVIKPADNTVDLVDPGSGLRLASIGVGSQPRKIGVAPDGKLAAVANCGPATAGTDGKNLTLSIVDLEQPRELHRLDVPLSTCPTAVSWYAPDRIALATAEPQGWIALEAASGQLVGPLSTAERAAVDAAEKSRSQPGRDTVAVQQFLASGGRFEDLVSTPVQPHATCHACTPEP